MRGEGILIKLIDFSARTIFLHTHTVAQTHTIAPLAFPLCLQQFDDAVLLACSFFQGGGGTFFDSPVLPVIFARAWLLFINNFLFFSVFPCGAPRVCVHFFLSI